MYTDIFKKLPPFTTYLICLKFSSTPDSRGYIFQQDGTPPHYWRPVIQAAHKLFLRGWIGRGDPVVWPPRSPHLTPLDFFLWGYGKERVCSTRVDVFQFYVIELYTGDLLHDYCILPLEGDMLTFLMVK